MCIYYFRGSRTRRIRDLCSYATEKDSTSIMNEDKIAYWHNNRDEKYLNQTQINFAIKYQFNTESDGPQENLLKNLFPGQTIVYFYKLINLIISIHAQYSPEKMIPIFPTFSLIYLPANP